MILVTSNTAAYTIETNDSCDFQNKSYRYQDFKLVYFHRNITLGW